MHQHTITSLAQLEEYAQRLAQTFSEGAILALQGEMGAGKTTFTQLLARKLGITHSIQSPTFSIINQYQLNDSQLFIHLDLYRLETTDQLMQLGLEELLAEPQHVVVIEWPELASELLPASTLWLHIAVNRDSSRVITESQHKT